MNQHHVIDEPHRSLEQVGYPKPFFFVFHGGSGSEKEDIEKAPTLALSRSAARPYTCVAGRQTPGCELWRREDERRH